MFSYEHGLRMARWMKKEDQKIQRAIRKVQADQYGVVALVFSKGAREMEIQILDEPYDDNVRVFPGEE